MTGSSDPFRLADLLDTDGDSRLSELQAITADDFIKTLNHGDLHRWLANLDQLPALQPASIELRTDVRVGSADDAGNQAALLEEQLRTFTPWRKGPFDLFGVKIDSEWQSGMKWDRLLPHIDSLQGHRVLDVGCGNGYHCWRALGEGARLVIGVEPYLLYVMQFLAIKRYLANRPCFLLPIRMAQYPGPFRFYDSVFSMGVLYHVRSPIDHLRQLGKCLAPGGQLILETLIVDGEEGYCLTPRNRYARMSNVWFVPTLATLERWLQRCGFSSIHLADVTITTASEQRSTSWMPFKSLSDGLDADNASLTIEGLPAPKRAVVVARAKD